MTWSGVATFDAGEVALPMSEVDVSAASGDKVLSGRAVIVGMTGGSDGYTIEFNGIGKLTQTASTPGRMKEKS